MSPPARRPTHGRAAALEQYSRRAAHYDAEDADDKRLALDDLDNE